MKEKDRELNNILLKFYLKTTRSDFLHYGFWEGNEELNFESFYNAQKRYLEKLIEFIPHNTKYILDVGCGTGENAKFLREKGFNLTCVTPDAHQEKIFKQKLPNIPFYLSKFEDFKDENNKYDLILMSESSQYIELSKLFKNSKSLLKDQGYLLISDFFKKEDKKIPDIFSGAHERKVFFEEAEKHNFEIINTSDITNNTAKTLDFINLLYTNYLTPSLELLNDVLKWKYPKLQKTGKFLFGKKIKNSLPKELVSKEDYKENIVYLICLFKKK